MFLSMVFKALPNHNANNGIEPLNDNDYCIVMRIALSTHFLELPESASFLILAIIIFLIKSMILILKQYQCRLQGSNL